MTWHLLGAAWGNRTPDPTFDKEPQVRRALASRIRAQNRLLMTFGVISLQATTEFDDTILCRESPPPPTHTNQIISEYRFLVSHAIASRYGEIVEDQLSLIWTDQRVEIENWNLHACIQ
ncbi:hypothetical protein [Nocardia noduli]|uniref:hypothetical protein n=1 Tax=Nocardia noduli TaxID=2815722 RepID=UPI001C20FF8B|nr:hypothetical protein [Nocardia noduli]